MKNFTWNCVGKLLYWEKPIVMGIINSTPDSFYDGGKLKTDLDILNQAEKMLHEGARILDIGGMSTRPNATIISVEEEIQRVEMPIARIHQHFPDALISIDTYNSKTAEIAIEQGATIINDISGGREDERIFEVAAKNQTPIILMHRKGNAQTMQLQTHYDNILTEIYTYFLEQITRAKEYGVKDVAIDLGFGFSKTLEQNYFLLKNLNYFTTLNVPILSGLSRKSMLYRLLDINASEALNATTVANMLALIHGTSILRVHDVKEAMECVEIFSNTYK